MEGEERQRGMHPDLPKYVANFSDLNLSAFKIADFFFPEDYPEAPEN